MVKVHGQGTGSWTEMFLIQMQYGEHPYLQTVKTIIDILK